MAQLTPYLTFNGNCREAMTFYKECFGGKLDLMPVGDSPMGAQLTEKEKKQIMHSSLENGAFTLMASDMIMKGEFIQGNTVTLALMSKERKEIETLFEKLSAGGNVRQPLKEEFFGLYGDLKDKFGVNWMFQCDLPKK